MGLLQYNALCHNLNQIKLYQDYAYTLVYLTLTKILHQDISLVTK